MNDSKKGKRAVLIDPFLRSVREVAHTGGLDALYALLQVRCVTAMPWDQAGHALYMDDEGLLVPLEEQRFFTLLDYMGTGKTYPQPFGGRALLVGTTNGGSDAAAKVPLEEVQRKIGWMCLDVVRAMSDLGAFDSVHTTSDGDVLSRIPLRVTDGRQESQPCPSCQRIMRTCPACQTLTCSEPCPRCWHDQETA